MTEHLSNEIIQYYRHKKLSAGAKFDADVHLSTCPSCREKLDGAERLQTLHRAFRTNFAFSPENVCRHLGDDEVLAYLNERLDAVEFEIADSHLAWCEQCQTEVGQMRAIASQFDPQPGPAVKTLNRIPPAFLSGLLQFFQLPLLRRQTAFALALLALGGFLGWLYLKDSGKKDGEISSSSPPPTKGPGNVESPVASASPVAVLPANPPAISESQASSTWLLGQDRDIFNEISKGGNLKLSGRVRELRELYKSASTGLGLDEKEKIQLLGPSCRLIRETQPTIRWRAYPGATTYKVIVCNGADCKNEITAFVNDTQWTPEQPLERNQRYTWQILVERPEGNVYSYWYERPFGDFFIIAEDELASVKQAEKHYRASSDPMARIALAARYAKAGLVEDAKRELKRFPTEHAQAPLAARLLNDLTRQTRR